MAGGAGAFLQHIQFTVVGKCIHMRRQLAKEYIVIEFAGGRCYRINTATPQTDNAMGAQLSVDNVGTVVAKLTEYGYELMDGVIPTGETHPAKANFILFMERGRL
jgi:hypothetical protein